MRRYYYDLNPHPAIRYMRKARKFFILLAILLLVGAGYIVYDVIQRTKESATPTAASTPTMSTIVSPIQLFRSEYFQFEADKSWTAIANESTSTKFVYRKINTGLVKGELDIYVNSPTFDQPSTKVMPVKINDNTLVSQGVSDNCSKLLKPPITSTPKVVTDKGVSFLCNQNDDLYSIVVGMPGSGTTLKVNRPGGGTASYSIFYSNVEFAPDEMEFTQLINTFQFR